MIFISRLSVVVFFYLYSYVLISNYEFGDQVHYRKLYDLFSDTRLNDILFVGLSTVGSSEPLTLFILWLGAFIGVDKDVYISVWNVILLFGFYLLSKKYKMSGLFIFLLVTNFYVVVLLTGAERLKFALIAIVYSFIYMERNTRLSVFYLMLSPLLHFQSLIFIISIFFFKMGAHTLLFLKHLRVKKFVLFFSIPAVLLFFILNYYFNDILSDKVRAYTSVRTVFDFFNILILSVIVLILGKPRLSYVLMFIPLYFFVFLFGGDRVNMISFLLSLFFLIFFKKADHPIFIILMVYFSIKSIPFINNILLFGDGFS